MKTFINQATGIYDEDDKKIIIKSNKVIAILKENYFTISISYIEYTDIKCNTIYNYPPV